MAQPKKRERRLDLSAGAEDPAERLFAEVAGILEHARRQTVRSVNTYMVTAYWLIGWRIVEAEQGGETRAGYGERLIEGLSVRLTKRFGRGFSMPNLRNFRGFYLAFQERLSEIRYTLCSEFEKHMSQAAFTARRRLIAAESTKPIEMGKEHERHGPIHDETRFHPNLGWSHYRALMRVENPVARRFYEDEAANADWSVRELQRQIGSLYYERLLASRDKRGMIREQRLTARSEALAVIKDPYVLEFLDLPEDHRLNETELEERLISHLQAFLLELGHGFALIGRQQRLTLDGDHFYADLVFYHVRLKCYVIIDLKTEKLTHADLGQMQLYVNYYDREVKGPDDNPTLGLILCTDKNEAVVRYVLGEGQEQIFASRYRMVLPTEEELAAEVRREMAALGLDDSSVAATAPSGSRKVARTRAKSRRNKRR
jgi:predicted nuclease of restriction endonuclease-like (RecB) superfamily